MTEGEGWWFETSRFEDAIKKEEPVNPGRYGERLARWLAAELRQRTWEVDDVFAEDWGWTIRLHRDEARFFVNCGNEDGSLVRWFVAPEPRLGLLRRLFGGNAPPPALAELDGDIEAIIAADPQTTWHGREQPD